MNRADCKTLRSAALELASWAASMQESNFDHGTRKVEWEPGTKASFEKHMRLVKRLRQIANAEQRALNGKGSSR